jgi:hypothetical protein
MEARNSPEGGLEVTMRLPALERRASQTPAAAEAA